jgi:hypothetical protein
MQRQAFPKGTSQHMSQHRMQLRLDFRDLRDKLDRENFVASVRGYSDDGFKKAL